jgi:hypothetical protein
MNADDIVANRVARRPRLFLGHGDNLFLKKL